MGVIIALAIFFLWGGHLYYLLGPYDINYTSPWFYFHILLQGYLYTGLFITAHDAMHGTVSSNKKLNKAVGYAASYLFAGLSYRKLKKNHFLHHAYPGSEKDPDYYTGSQNFFIWWFSFMRKYVTITQLIIMAVAYNVLSIWVHEPKIIYFWIIPAFLGTFQLFYFGTYAPHKKPHSDNMEPHKARTLAKNHLWAMLSCYFFGYHYEHHEKPGIPWWKLYRSKTG